MRLGALQHTPARIQPPAESPRETWRATGMERAVFADPSGRRARLMSGLGVGIVAAALAALAIVVTGAVGLGGLPLRTPLIAGRAPGHPAGAFAASRHRVPVLLAHVRPVDRDEPASPRARRLVRGSAAPPPAHA